MKESVDGWFKLLSQEEGDFYAVPVLGDEGPMCKPPISVKNNFDHLSWTIEKSEINEIFENLTSSETLIFVKICILPFLGSHSNDRNIEFSWINGIVSNGIVDTSRFSKSIGKRKWF